MHGCSRSVTSDCGTVSMGTFADLSGRGFNQEVSSYDPTWRDRLGAWLMGDSISNARRDFVSGLLGSTGLGTAGPGLIDLTPAGIPLAVQEDYQAGNWKDIPLDLFPPVRAARGVLP